MNTYFSCDVCFEAFQSQNVPDEYDRRPAVLCSNGHTFCVDCCSQPQLNRCPICRESALEKPIINLMMSKAIDENNNHLSTVPLIRPDELSLDLDEPLGSGSFSDVFSGTWLHQQVAVKRLRVKPQSAPMQQLKIETTISISLHHPNIVRVFGMTKMENSYMGIVMEFADKGSLRGFIGKLSESQKTSIALGICAGVHYLHSKKVAHRDLKPDNILLFGESLIAKVSDFGTSKVIQTCITNTSVAGTPKYSAPELLNCGVQYGASVDVFSLAIVLYEMFTGKDPFPRAKTVSQVVAAILSGKRPDFPNIFHENLRSLIVKGWSDNSKDRPSVKAFLDECKELNDSNLNETVSTIIETTMSIRDQTQSVSLQTMPVPLISMRWKDNLELDNSEFLRKKMIESLQEKSNLKSFISASVIKAMEVVPRHLFASQKVMSDQGRLELIYTHNKAMAATDESNESSPEIIGVQLSLVKIVPGFKVLLVGGKGGYINSLVAQIVGIHGEVVTVSSSQHILDTCKKRVSDSLLCNMMKWIKVSKCSKDSVVRDAIDPNTKFDAIIYCGVVDKLPNLDSLIEERGSLIAPVKVSSTSQQLQMLTLESQSKKEIRKISEFGVSFETPK